MRTHDAHIIFQKLGIFFLFSTCSPPFPCSIIQRLSVISFNLLQKYFKDILCTGEGGTEKVCWLPHKKLLYAKQNCGFAYAWIVIVFSPHNSVLHKDAQTQSKEGVTARCTQKAILMLLCFFSSSLCPRFWIQKLYFNNVLLSLQWARSVLDASQFQVCSLFSLSLSYTQVLLNLSAFWVSVNLRISFLSIRPRFLALKVRLNGSFMQISSASKEQGTIWLRRNENWELGFFPSLSASLSWSRARVSEVQMHSFWRKL